MFFRQSIENILNEKESVPIPVQTLNNDGNTVISFYVSKEMQKNFLAFCRERNYKSAEVIRGFITFIPNCFDSRQSVRMQDTLFYFLAFLQNAMKAEGYALTDMKDIQIQRTDSYHPLIQEEKTGKTRVFKVFDKEGKQLYLIPFRKMR